MLFLLQSISGVPVKLFVQAVNQTYLAPLHTQLDSPTYSLVQAPYTQLKQPLTLIFNSSSPFRLQSLQTYLNDSMLWASADCQSAQIGASPQNCSSEGLQVEQGTVKQVLNTMAGQPSKLRQMSGNGIILTGKVVSGLRTGIFYTLYNNQIINFAVYDSNLTLLQTYNITLANQSALNFMFGCPRLVIQGLFDTLFAYCDFSTQASHDIIFWPLYNYTLNGSTRVFNSVSYGKAGIYSLKVNPLVYQLKQSPKWSLTFATGFYPEICQVQGLNMSCLQLKISLRPITSITTFFDSWGEGTILYYNSLEVYQFVFPQFLHRFSPKVEAAISYAAINSQYLFVKLGDSSFQIFNRERYNTSILTLATKGSFIFLPAYFNLRDSFFVLSFTNMNLMYKIETPKLQISIGNIQASNFVIQVLANNGTLNQTLLFQVIVTSPLLPTFDVISVKQKTLLSNINLVQIPLLLSRRFVGPLIGVLPLWLTPFRGAIICTNNIIYKLPANQTVLALVTLSFNTILVLLNNTRPYSAIIKFDPFTVNQESYDQPLQQSKCFNSSLKLIGKQGRLMVFSGNTNICLCDYRFECIVLLNSNGKLLASQMQQGRILAIQQGSGGELFLLALDQVTLLNRSIGNLPGNFNYTLKPSLSLLMVYNKTIVQIFQINIYSNLQQLRLKGTKSLQSGCQPAFTKRLLLVCPGLVYVEEYDYQYPQLPLLRTIPLFQYTVLNMVAQQGGFVVVSALFPDKISKGFVVLNPDYQTVSVMRSVMMGSEPIFVTSLEKESSIGIVFQYQGQQTVKTIQQDNQVVIIQNENSIVLNLNVSVELAIVSPFNFNYFDFMQIQFDLSSSLIQPISNFSLPFPAPPSIYLQEIEKARVNMSVESVVGPVANYSLALKSHEAESQTILILQEYIKPLRTLTSPLQLTVYGSIYNMLLIQFPQQNLLNGIVIGACLDALVLLSDQQNSYFTWKSLGIKNPVSSCQFGMLESLQGGGSFLMFCQQQVNFELLPFKIPYLITVLKSFPFDVTLANFSFPDIVDEFITILAPSQTNILLSTPTFTNKDIRNLLLCNLSTSINVFADCCGLVSPFGSLQDFVFDGAYMGGGVTAVEINKQTIDVFVLGSEVDFLGRTLILCNYSISLQRVFKSVKSESQRIYFVRIQSREGSNVDVFLTAQTFYLQLTLVSNNQFQVKNLYYKYFSCLSNQNLQFSPEIIVAPCNMVYPERKTFLQIFIRNQSQHPRLIYRSWSQIFVLKRDLKLISSIPELILVQIRVNLSVEVITSSRYVSFELIYSNQYFQTSTLVQLYRKPQHQVLIPLFSAMSLLALLWPLFSSLLVYSHHKHRNRPKQPALEIELTHFKRQN